LGALVDRPVGDVVAAERDGAGGDFVLGRAEKGGAEGALARAVRAHDRVHLAGRDREVETAQDLGGWGLTRLDDRAGAQALDAEQLAHAAKSYASGRICTTAVVEIQRQAAT